MEVKLRALAAAHRAEAAAARKQREADHERAEALRKISAALEELAAVAEPPHSTHYKREAGLAAREARLFDGMARLRKKETDRADGASQISAVEAQTRSQGRRSSSMMKDRPKARIG